MIFIIFFICLLGFWIYAEYHLKPIARIAGGLACIIYVAYLTFVLANIIPGYERHFTKRAMVLCEQALTNGSPQIAIQAIHAYNNLATTNSTYHASMEMWRTLAPIQKP